ncbi:MAG: hypothetical protein AMXMBFR47_28090 [Planctomycetota bacterium]
MRREYLVGVGFVGVAVVVFLGVLFYNPDPQQSTLPLSNDGPAGGKGLADARPAGDVPEPKLTSMNPPQKPSDPATGSNAQTPVTEPRVEPSNLPAAESRTAAIPTGPEQPVGGVLTHNSPTGTPTGGAAGRETTLPPGPGTTIDPGAPAGSPDPAPAKPEPAKPEIRTGGEEIRPNRGGLTPPTVTPNPVGGGDGAPRGAAPGGVVSPSAGKPISHKIEKNDTLVSLAEKYYGDRDQWRRIEKANKSLNAKKLYVGRTIVIPPKEDAPASASRTEPAPPAAPASGGTGATTPAGTRTGRAETRGTYTVGENDTLVKIARSQLGDGERWREIYELNRDKLSNPNRVIKGMVLKMPARTDSTANAGRTNP